MRSTYIHTHNDIMKYTIIGKKNYLQTVENPRGTGAIQKVGDLIHMSKCPGARY